MPKIFLIKKNKINKKIQINVQIMLKQIIEIKRLIYIIKGTFYFEKKFKQNSSIIKY